MEHRDVLHVDDYGALLVGLSAVLRYLSYDGTLQRSSRPARVG
jgi:hypothetical protein